MKEQYKLILNEWDHASDGLLSPIHDADLARLTKTSPFDLRNHLESMEQEGLIERVRVENPDGFKVLTTALGRTELSKLRLSQDQSRKDVVKPPAIKVVPKGLRSYEEEDAYFFLELLPGTRDRDGLPESIRYWKIPIERTDADRTFRVGLIYGPSGTGKSSLVKAGLLPRLAEHVLSIHIEVTADGTEARLLNSLHKNCPELSIDLGLEKALEDVSKGQELPPGKKLLIVLDQFEQWLSTWRGDEESDLFAALRHCDGGHVQAIVLVRDDFWMAVNSFEKQLGVEFRRTLNSYGIDLFDPIHAKKVLMDFGRGFGQLPDHQKDLSNNQKAFLDQAVEGLIEKGKVVPVRLSLFAWMVRGKPWATETLRNVGGAEGVGLNFLEETFNSPHAEPKYRFHQRAAQAVLKALLPEGGTRIRGEAKSYSELISASGYAHRPGDFEDLCRILDGEARLITPTAREESSTTDQEELTKPIEQYYQLAHDYLVPSIREWLTRKQRETRRGRAELRLAELSSLWNAKPENRRLPSLLEWTNIGLLTKKKDWTEPQRKMMRRAGRVHGVRGLTLAAVLILLGWGGCEVNGWLKAQMLRDELLASPLSDVPAIIAELGPYRRWIDPLLRLAFTEAKEAGNSQKQLHAALALLPVDDTQVTYLKDRLLRADANDISVIRQSLAGHKDALVAECWRVLQKPTLDDQGKALQAASALALYDPENHLWEEIRFDVANRLVAENAYVIAKWIDALRPVGERLRDPLIAIFRDEKRGESERTQAASALGEYLSEQPNELAGLLIDATEKQFAALYPSVERRSEQTAPLLEEELSRKPTSMTMRYPTEVESEALDKFYKRQANAAVALIRMGRTEKSWSLLKHTPDPSLRSYLVNSLGPRGVEPGLLIAKLDQESDVSIRRALILSLGNCEEGRLRSDERIDWTTRLLNLYRNDPDPGIHGASEWLLRQWGNETQIQGIDKELGKLPLPTLRADQGEASSKGNIREWYVNSQGQTMVVVRGPVEFEMGEADLPQAYLPHRENIGHSFAIASKEVTVEQFETFLKENPRVQVKNYKTYSPIPTCPMNSVSWFDAAAYCNWLSKKDGIPEGEWCYGPNEKGNYAGGMKLMSNAGNRKGYRLPTDAEWEFSCRAGASTGYSFGEPWKLLEKYGWYDKNSPNRSQPVGSLKPNDLGLFDLHGNIWEWCQDRYKEPGKENNGNDKHISSPIDYKDPRLLRGGTFDNRSGVRPLGVPWQRSPRRAVTLTTVSAPPGLTTDSLYFFTTSALQLLNEHVIIRLHSRKQPPGAAGSEPKKRMPLPIWQSIMR